MFFADADYRLYLRLLGEITAQYGVRLRGYCLMPNHTHLVPVPATEDALARAVGLVHQRYSQLLNLREAQTGHRWQNRFYSCPLDETALPRVLRYAERNPVRAGLAAHPWDWPWSSAGAHCTGHDPFDLLDLTGWTDDWPGDAWRDYLVPEEEPGEAELIRLATTIGRPLGSDAFFDRLEAHTGRRLRPKPVGRPRKTEEDK
jgi:putative transposase